MSDELWILVNIGCIECGVSSAIVGVFRDKAVADAHAQRLNASGDFTWRENGQNGYEVFAMPPIDVLAPEYADNPTEARP